MKRLFMRVGRLWCVGLALLLLRLTENRFGFDPATGLALPNLPGTIAAWLIAADILVELALCFRLPKEKISYADGFAPPERELAWMITGSLLIAAGGALMAAAALPLRTVAPIVAGVLGVFAGAGLLLMVKQTRGEEALTVAPLLPLVFFGVFFVLAVYTPAENDPVLSRYYMQVLAACLAACSFALLAGFLRKESRLRTFAFAANLAVPVCLAAAADSGLAQRVVFCGCAVVLSVFLLLRREEPRSPAENEEAAAD